MHNLFEEDLEKLRSRIIRMGSIVEEQVEFSFQSLLERKVSLARIVIERDDKVDKLDIKIDQQCQKIFALHQPVASDLRLLLAALKINNELERIGDIALSISRIALALEDNDICTRIGLEQMTNGAFAMVKHSLDSFINNDPALARHVLSTDHRIDALERDISKIAMEMMKKDPLDIEPGVRVIVGLRYIERIADHATNIAENVIFLVEAKLVSHLTIEDDDFVGELQA